MDLWKRIRTLKEEAIYHAYLAGEPLHVISKTYRVNVNDVKEIVRRYEKQKGDGEKRNFKHCKFT